MHTDGDQGRAVTASAQGPAIGVVGEDGAIGAKLVDERCRVGGAGQLCPAEASPRRVSPRGRPAGWRGRPGAAGSGPRGHRRSSGGRDRGRWRWCSRGGTGRQPGRRTRLIRRIDQDRPRRLPVPHLPPRIPGISQDRRDRPQRPPRTGPIRRQTGTRPPQWSSPAAARLDHRPQLPHPPIAKHQPSRVTHENTRIDRITG